MGWDETGVKEKVEKQTELILPLDDDQEKVVGALRDHGMFTSMRFVLRVDLLLEKFLRCC